jgi:hypothetical protein
MATDQSTTVSSGVEYREIPGFPGYRVGSDGSVWSRQGRGKRHGTLEGTWRRLRERIKDGGYHYVVPCCSSQSTRPHNVARLVLLAFVGPCPDGMECCHNDGNPHNNSFENLRWDTRSANAADRNRHGRGWAGEGHPKAKLDADAVRQIRAEHARGESCPSIAARRKLDRGTVWMIVTRRTWKHVA